jgi:hypothetical protein
MADIALLFNGVWSHYVFARADKYAPHYELLYKDDIARLDHKALIVPFQTDHTHLARHRETLEAHLAKGRTIAFFGDADLTWLGAHWEHRPIDNSWWKHTPDRPPIIDTDRTHPLYAQLSVRHGGWHHHGVYTRVPDNAHIIQRSRAGEIVTWQAPVHQGLVFASTKDPIVEHGVQQIRHLDHYCDALTEWLCGVRPSGAFTINPQHFGVDWSPRAPQQNK